MLESFDKEEHDACGDDEPCEVMNDDESEEKWQPLQDISNTEWTSERKSGNHYKTYQTQWSVRNNDFESYSQTNNNVLTRLFFLSQAS